MISGNIQKMRSRLTDTVCYELPIGEEFLPMNDFVGRTVTLSYSGTINCIHCGRKTSKSYSQGHCYPCMTKLASCDMCIVKPETCHYDQGTCREPDWAQSHCMQPHYVYLANASGVKVGITRESQIPTRWIDQGAVQALPIAKVDTRYHVGLMEVIIKTQVSDKTDWRKMLKNQVEKLDLAEVRNQVFQNCSDEFEKLAHQIGSKNLSLFHDAEEVSIQYPVIQYPDKVKALNFDKNPEVSGKLLGIKGQYLIFDTGVLNVRKFTGYELRFTS